MNKLLISSLLLSLWLILDGSRVWAIDVGWMQEGVRVWYFGGDGSASSSNAEEAYLLKGVSGSSVQVTKHSGLNHWSTANPIDTSTYSFLDKGPCWIHPQTLQNLQSGDNWMGFEIVTIQRSLYTYDMLPYHLLPAKALFDLQPQREVAKITYMAAGFGTGTAYFDADTGLCLMYSQMNGSVPVSFILSEINYDFAIQRAFAEDNGPHTGFKSSVLEQQIMPVPDTRGGNVFIQSSVESRYGTTVEMWVSTSESGNISSYMPPYENYCFFGSVPVLRRMDMTQAPDYPPEQWNAYGQYLWWWVPAEVLQQSTINVFGVPMARTSTSPYVFSATQQPAGLFFSKLWFDNDGYLTDFSVRDSNTGLDIDPERSAIFYQNSTTVNGLSYYRNTMGRAVPAEISYRLTLTVVSDTTGKGGGSILGDGSISCIGQGSNPSGMRGTCHADFPSGSNVNLYQTPDSDSTWATWTASGCGTGQSCAVLMNGAQNVTVNFPYSFMAKVGSTNKGHDSLALAYDNAGPVDTIYGRAVTITEDVTLSGSKTVTLLGGRDAMYQPQNAWTTLQGKLRIKGGSLKVERLVIK